MLVRRIPTESHAGEWDGTIDGARSLRLEIIYPGDGGPFRVYLRRQGKRIEVMKGDYIVHFPSGDRKLYPPEEFWEKFEEVR